MFNIYLKILNVKYKYIYYIYNKQTRVAKKTKGYKALVILFIRPIIISQLP